MIKLYDWFGDIHRCVINLKRHQITHLKPRRHIDISLTYFWQEDFELSCDSVECLTEDYTQSLPLKNVSDEDVEFWVNAFILKNVVVFLQGDN